ncbi:G-type lectin S-receptor-like serine/threonine-protein kinase At2g19130 [Cannabis sativa]|uniref:G-type lectin S-receptor-like serine/threonine-protein kinase At2g19130 n=1 Tax=Cannabis sativa TaxID=3483 RepID=UPI0029CA6463|nr:G-type lectin S-receptor-like serine/threonine-protein kinase At2g19130 [Cannabis sativa]
MLYLCSISYKVKHKPCYGPFPFQTQNFVIVSEEFYATMATNTNRKVMFLALLLCLVLKTHIAFGAETITANQSLSGDQTIVSASEVYELGFFTPGKTTLNYYIGMWYKRDPYKTILWVANREKPVMDRFSSKLIISNSNLVLINELKIPVWSTNVSFPTSGTSVRATLQDDGNIVLLDDEFDESKLLWQSFDYPTDTWLPGASLGFNKITKRKQILTSWKNLEDPSPGLFTFELVPSDGFYIILWNRSRSYWTTGPWTGDIFTLVPEMRGDPICYFKFVSNESDILFTMYAHNTSGVSRLVMDVSGQMKQLGQPSKRWNLLWSFPRQQCQVYAFCGAYGSCSENSLPFCQCLMGFQPKSQRDWDLKDYSGGCMRKSQLNCLNNSLPNDEKDRFLEVPSMSVPENAQSEPVRSITECESTCLNNCHCIAYTYNTNGCSIWTRDLLNLNQLATGDSNGRTLYIRLAASEFQSTKKSKGKIVGVAVGSPVGLIVLLCLILYLALRHRRKTIGMGTLAGGSLVAFGYRDLQYATKNFSEKLGGGGFGSVFKGKLNDSTEIAVKKLESVHQGEKQFRTEVSTIGTLQHVNLVRLRGFCSQGTNKLLVYDYMSNGSLDSHLFCQNDSSNVLDWKTRFEIAVGTARGLVYLHEKCRECIIHCDIKPENILLNVEFCAKIADFGLAKLVGREFSRVLTTMRGTRGYLAPEWIAGVAITPKADVYSYGMMLFELISGKRNSEISEDGKVQFFATRAARLIVEGGDVLSLLDTRLEGNANIEELRRVCVVSCWCIQDNETQRPSMGCVVQMLEGIIEMELPPVPRSIQLFVENQDNIVFYTESCSSQSSHLLSDMSSASYESKSNISTMSMCLINN